MHYVTNGFGITAMATLPTGAQAIADMKRRQAEARTPAAIAAADAAWKADVAAGAEAYAHQEPAWVLDAKLALMVGGAGAAVGAVAALATGHDVTRWAVRGGLGTIVAGIAYMSLFFFGGGMNDNG